MVTTRSQAAKRHATVEVVIPTPKPTPKALSATRRSSRIRALGKVKTPHLKKARTKAKTPKTKAKTKAKLRTKTSKYRPTPVPEPSPVPAPASPITPHAATPDPDPEHDATPTPTPGARFVTPVPIITTNDRAHDRSWPSTPNAPRKSIPVRPAPRLHPRNDFPPSLSDVEMTPTPIVPSYRMLVRGETPLRGHEYGGPLIVAEDGSPLNSGSGSGLGASSTPTPTPTPGLEPQPHTYLSPNDITSSIPGRWTRDPGSCSQRLVVDRAVEEITPEQMYERESRRQLEYNRIFEEQYDALMKGKEESDRRIRAWLAKEAQREEEGEAMECD
ncbi:hypothetical protein VNI00_019470 [Paramarasmius palmivorus]|uniref:Uncharacterized protein n=1 Tax=Paramarasmius palmivorus TaxID=297713 RepID=A0AAW0AL37_9AGAR